MRFKKKGPLGICLARDLLVLRDYLASAVTPRYNSRRTKSAIKRGSILAEAAPISREQRERCEQSNSLFLNGEFCYAEFKLYRDISTALCLFATSEENFFLAKTDVDWSWCKGASGRMNAYLF